MVGNVRPGGHDARHDSGIGARPLEPPRFLPRASTAGNRGYFSRPAGDHRIMDMTVTVDLFSVGAAGLALWTVARFPSFGPHGVIRSMLVVIGAFALMSMTDG